MPDSKQWIVRPAEVGDLKAIYEHLKRHTLESGNDGDIIFTPSTFSEEETPYKDFADKKIDAWTKGVTDPGWEKLWILTDGETVKGELRLVHSPHLKATLHRCLLMTGIERSHRGKGWGSRFLDAAIRWARLQPSLDWIQLYVFSHNERARRLYKAFGFIEVGTTPDMFRVKGQMIDDIEMVLRLRGN